MSRGILGLLASALSFHHVAADICGSLTINEDGTDTTRYVASTYCPGVSSSGTTLSLPHDAQVQIAQDNSGSYSPEMFVWYTLNGKTVSYVADLSSIACSCNMALYFVSMPATNSDGSAAGGDSGDYYCDANDVNGELCWELDVMEANMYVSQSTPHSCDQSPHGAIYSCDGGGCGTNSYYVNGGGMCPGGSCTINTQSPFNFSMSFSTSNMHVKMTQGNNGNTFEFDVCSDGGYLSNFGQALNSGMVMVMSYWGTDYGTMSWLDSMTGCTGDCDTSGTAKFSDIKVYSTSIKEKERIKNWSKKNIKSRLVEKDGKYDSKEKISVPVAAVDISPN